MDSRWVHPEILYLVERALTEDIGTGDMIDGMKLKLGEYKMQLDKNREALRGL